MQKVYIFGAHSRARTLAAYLEYLSDCRVKAYLYDNEEPNPNKIGSVPVFRLSRDVQVDTVCPVYIGTRGAVHSQITETLKSFGFKDIYPVTAELDRRFRNAYLEKYFKSTGREFLKIEMLEEAGDVGKPEYQETMVYVVKSALDRPLEREYPLAAYERIIQAGAELTDVRLYPGVLTDNVGENISAKNRQYCELTAMYWIWKHAEAEVVGMAHYRRHFILPENWTRLMQEHEVDVILPTPLYVSPDIAGNYKNRHDPVDWDFLMYYLKECALPEDREAEAFFEGNLYSPCNMFIMKRRVLNEFCAWLFPILEAVEAHSGRKEDGYQNRYPGFLSERLLTFYFEKKRDRYKIIYADKNFLP